MDNKPTIAVIGLGSMGTALAKATLSAGYRTTVWNRTAAKADRLAAAGARSAPSVADAVASSDVALICVADYAAVRSLLEPIPEAVSGRTLINVTSGTTNEVRAMADWAASHDVRYLDGVMMAFPDSIATPDALLLYSGAAEVFDQYRDLLELLGTTRFLGTDATLAEHLDMGLLGAGYGMLGGFLHATAVLNEGRVRPSEFTALVTHWLRGLLDFLPVLAAEIESGDYSDSVSSVEMNKFAVDHIIRHSEEHGIAADVHRPLQALLNDAADRSPKDSVAATVVAMRRA